MFREFYIREIKKTEIKERNFFDSVDYKNNSICFVFKRNDRLTMQTRMQLLTIMFLKEPKTNSSMFELFWKGKQKIDRRFEVLAENELTYQGGQATTTISRLLSSPSYLLIRVTSSFITSLVVGKNSAVSLYEA